MQSLQPLPGASLLIPASKSSQCCPQQWDSLAGAGIQAPGIFCRAGSSLADTPELVESKVKGKNVSQRVEKAPSRSEAGGTGSSLSPSNFGAEGNTGF